MFVSVLVARGENLSVRLDRFSAIDASGFERAGVLFIVHAVFAGPKQQSVIVGYDVELGLLSLSVANFAGSRLV